MTMMTRPRSLLLVSILLAACAPDRPDDADRGAVPDSVASAAAADTGRADTASAAPATNPAASMVSLAADGLQLTAGGAPRRLAFGTARGPVLADVGGVLGEPTKQGTMEECPSGPLFQVDYGAGLQLSFQDSAFVGWFAREGSALRTAAGIGPGSTLGQLRAAYPGTTVEETSLGYEFAASELYGIVTDTTDVGQVQVVFAGINCIFR
jgi:hypothetical protein